LRGDLALDKISVTSQQVASHESPVTDSFTRNLRSGAGQFDSTVAPGCTRNLRSGAGQFDSTVAPGCTRHSQPVDPQPGLPGFVFVQTKEEKEKLCSHGNPGLPILVLHA